MQHEPTSLLYLSENQENNIIDVAHKLNDQFKFNHLKNEDDLLNYIVHDIPSVLLIDLQFYNWTINVLQKFSPEGKSDNILVILLGSQNLAADSHSFLYDVVSVPIDKTQLAFTLNNAHSHLLMKREIVKLQHTLSLQNKELHELNNIGIALSAERDPDKLLETILFKSREITHADAGSLYLVEAKKDVPADENNYFANKQLRFKLAHNDSVSVGFTEFVMPIEKKSIAGFVALSSQVLNIPDVYKLPPNCEYGHNRSFDESVGYRTKSMLVIPMKTHKDEIIGVLQLINRKKEWKSIVNNSKMIEEQIIPFDEKCVDLASSLASQAAISIENNRLYEEIKKLFEGFIKASVHAIEQRDPTTSGHSERVAILTSELAKTVDKIDSGKFKDVKFSRDEIQTINYASLLHDFGKIGVRENILVKAKKLFPHELDSVKARFRFFEKANELKFSYDKITHLLNHNHSQALEYLHKVDEKIKKYKDELFDYLNLVIEANEPKVLREHGHDMLTKIGEVLFQDNGRTELLLKRNEIQRLSIPKGSLSEEERVEIESHVTHTFNFLSRIPWTSELRDIPQIAYAHHEKLDGSGYPRGLASKEIPIQSKMMAISDIYDALTAWDRPYKKAVPVEKALDILQWEVNDGKIDGDLYKIFVEAKLYDLVKKPE